MLRRLATCYLNLSSLTINLKNMLAMAVEREQQWFCLHRVSCAFPTPFGNTGELYVSRFKMLFCDIIGVWVIFRV